MPWNVSMKRGAFTSSRSFLRTLRMCVSTVRVVTPDVGGGFGPKGSYYPEYVNIAVAAMMLNRPVKWIEVAL